MTDSPQSNDDWLSNAAPPPRSLDPAMQAAPARPMPERARAKDKPPVQGLRPLDALAAEIEGAPIADAPDDDLPPEPDPGPDPGPDPASDQAPPDRRPGRPKGEIWEGCPVKALGVNGGTSYFLDVLGQLRAVGKLERMTIMHLFGHRYPALCWNFPQMNMKADPPTRKPGKFDGDSAAAAMTQAAAEKGLFDPEGAVRGVGAWTDDDGRLVYHLGDRLIVAGEERAPDTHHGRIYPSYPPIPHPVAAGETLIDPVPALAEVLQTWQWARPDVDWFICLGQIGVQMMGGALDWRPAYWFTGGPGSGKSALQRLMLHLHGGEKGLIQSTDPTARGIASLLGQSTLPVALDELEPGDQGSSKERDIIVTARVAASGGRWVRGSSDQKGSTGQLRSTFLFSSILIPGILKSQDLQRIIMLSLRPFPEGAKAPDLRADRWRRAGAALKRLIIDRWPTWAERLELWRVSFAEAGIAGRDADNWATTLAMADMMHSAAMPSAEVRDGWVAKIAAEIRSATREAGTDADEVLVHLLSQPYILEGGREQYTIAQWLQVAARLPSAPDSLLNGFTLDDQDQERRATLANAKLSKLLIKVIRERDEVPRLFVGNNKAHGIMSLFRDTQWAGGAWKQSLERVPGALSGRDRPSRTLAGIATRGVEIPFTSIPGLAAFPQDRDRQEPAAAPPMPADFEDFH